MTDLFFPDILDNFVSQPTEVNMKGLVNFARSGSMSNDDIAQLAKVLANSDHNLQIAAKNSVSDIPSTGGPSSLSTLICPLFLKGFNCVVPKLGVPGRPAGAIDVLAQIDGYNINPDRDLIKKWLLKTGYVHFLAGENYAPLDAKLFSYRKKIGAVNVYSLVIASILSKKVAVNLTNTGLDIRISDFGNFGTTWYEAEDNAQRFIQVASKLGIKARCFLTNGNVPYQPYIGRGESLLAIKKIFEGNIDYSLRSHLEECYAMSASVADHIISTTVDYEGLTNNFRRNIEIQGASFDSFIRVTEEINKAHNYEIRADHSGFLVVNLQAIRRILVNCQNKKASISDPFPDPSGIILKKTTGEFINKNEAICTYRCENIFCDYMDESLKKAFTVSSQKEVPYKFQEIK